MRKCTQLTGPFRKSRNSGNPDGCVEIAPLADGGKAVRDSLDPSGPVLYFTPTEWSAFAAGMADGEFD